MQLTRTAAIQIAKDFLIRTNPSKWDGTSKPQKPVDTTHYAAYDINLPDDSLLYLQLERDPDTKAYFHNASIYNETTGTDATLSGDGISWPISIAATILRLCRGIELTGNVWRYLP